jgi:hypothetical protein
MLVRIEARQRLDPVRPEDGEHGKKAAEEGEWSDQSNSGDEGTGSPDSLARAFVSRLRVSMVVTVATRHYRHDPDHAVQCGD